MPDMSNWSLNEVKTYCNLIGLNLEYSGYGYVTNQSIAPNTVNRFSKHDFKHSARVMQLFLDKVPKLCSKCSCYYNEFLTKNHL